MLIIPVVEFISKRLLPLTRKNRYNDTFMGEHLRLVQLASHFSFCISWTLLASVTLVYENNY